VQGARSLERNRAQSYLKDKPTAALLEDQMTRWMIFAQALFCCCTILLDPSTSLAQPRAKEAIRYSEVFDPAARAGALERQLLAYRWSEVQALRALIRM